MPALVVSVGLLERFLSPPGTKRGEVEGPLPFVLFLIIKRRDFICLFPFLLLIDNSGYN